MIFWGLYGGALHIALAVWSIHYLQSQPTSHTHTDSHWWLKGNYIKFPILTCLWNTIMVHILGSDHLMKCWPPPTICESDTIYAWWQMKRNTFQWKFWVLENYELSLEIQFFQIEFCRISRIYRICRKLFLLFWKWNLLRIVFDKVYRLCKIQFGKTQTVCLLPATMHAVSTLFMFFYEN